MCTCMLTKVYDKHEFYIYSKQQQIIRMSLIKLVTKVLENDEYKLKKSDNQISSDSFE